MGQIKNIKLHIVTDIKCSKMAEEGTAVPNTPAFDLSNLRNLVRDYVDNHLYPTALFWADKICTLSGNEEQDVLWLAHILFHTRQYLRASHLLVSHGLVANNLVARYLAAKCYFE